MSYTPELNAKYSGTLRRIAWAFGIPMTRAIEGIFDHASKYIDREKVCDACRDDSFCKQCPFNHNDKNAQVN